MYTPLAIRNESLSLLLHIASAFNAALSGIGIAAMEADLIRSDRMADLIRSDRIQADRGRTRRTWWPLINKQGGERERERGREGEGERERERERERD